MKTLIIDDDDMSARDLMDALEKIYQYPVDAKPVLKTQPDDGIYEMNHSYQLVFIDFKFDFHKETGADIGLEIRRRYPLATMILVTAHGEDNILDYIHVGFDAYLDKDKGRFGISQLKEVISIGHRNAQSRIKSKFNEAEMIDVKEKFNAILDVLDSGCFEKYGSLAVYGDLLQKGVSTEDLKENSSKIERMIGERKKQFVDSSGKLYPMVGRTAINTYLKVYQTDKFIADSSALKLRQYILETPEKNQLWKRLSTMKSFGRFLSDFDLNVR